MHHPTAWPMTSRMHTDISPGQWQPWTAVSPLLGLINNFFFVLPTKPPCYAGYVTTDHCDASCPLAIWCRYAFSVKSNRCAQQASASRQVYEILISYPDLPRPRKTEWDLGTRLMKSSPEWGGLHHSWAKNSGDLIPPVSIKPLAFGREISLDLQRPTNLTTSTWSLSSLRWLPFPSPQ